MRRDRLDYFNTMPDMIDEVCSDPPPYLARSQKKVGSSPHFFWTAQEQYPPKKTLVPNRGFFKRES
eukprot:5484752-Amphidinium_carterae.1